jgi:hypothetical protein
MRELAKFSLARALSGFSPELRAKLHAIAATAVANFEKALFAEGVTEVPFTPYQRLCLTTDMTASVNEAVAKAVKSVFRESGIDPRTMRPKHLSSE